MLCQHKHIKCLNQKAHDDGVIHTAMNAGFVIITSNANAITISDGQTMGT
jgi:hypothetical protein